MSDPFDEVRAWANGQTDKNKQSRSTMTFIYIIVVILIAILLLAVFVVMYQPIKIVPVSSLNLLTNSTNNIDPEDA